MKKHLGASGSNLKDNCVRYSVSEQEIFSSEFHGIKRDIDNRK